MHAAKTIVAAADTAAQQLFASLPPAGARPAAPAADAAPPAAPTPPILARPARHRRAPTPSAAPAGDLTPAAHDLIMAARQAPTPVTWADAAVLAGKVPQGGHFEATRKQLRDSGHQEPWPNDLVDQPDAPRFGVVIDSLAPGFATGASGQRRG